MNTVFSHIVQKCLPEYFENIATEALAFILHSDESARSGIMKFLRGIAPGLPPSLHFHTQQTDDKTRPDMCGFDGTTVRVFIENKFWAGLTENQPVHYPIRLRHCCALLFTFPPGLGFFWNYDRRTRRAPSHFKG